MIRRLSWIHEEDNREEDSSSFSELGMYQQARMFGLR